MKKAAWGVVGAVVTTIIAFVVILFKRERISRWARSVAAARMAEVSTPDETKEEKNQIDREFKRNVKEVSDGIKEMERDAVVTRFNNVFGRSRR